VKFPELLNCGFAIVGFALSEIKGPGPCHTNCNPGVAVNPELKERGVPVQTGLLEVTFNCGVGFTTTVVDPVQVAAPVAVTV
jgi:hypothetical protein